MYVPRSTTNQYSNYSMPDEFVPGPSNAYAFPQYRPFGQYGMQPQNQQPVPNVLPSEPNSVSSARAVPRDDGQADCPPDQQSTAEFVSRQPSTMPTGGVESRPVQMIEEQGLDSGRGDKSRFISRMPTSDAHGFGAPEPIRTQYSSDSSLDKKTVDRSRLATMAMPRSPKMTNNPESQVKRTSIRERIMQAIADPSALNGSGISSTA